MLRFTLLALAFALAANADQDGGNAGEPAPFQCFNCNSVLSIVNESSPFYHSHCPVDGNIDTAMNNLMDCSVRWCYSRVASNPPGVVYRGCGDAIYMGEHEVPTECFKKYAMEGKYDLICPCSTTGCNTQDLSAESLLYYNEYQEPGSIGTPN